MKLVQVANYVLNHKGQVWCVETNEMIYSSTYEDALQFIQSLA